MSVDENAQARQAGRLTEEQKKQNHIESERKRRNALREKFDDLSKIVPNMSESSRSEGLMLDRTIEFLESSIDERKALLRQLKEHGVLVDEKYEKEIDGVQIKKSEASSSDLHGRTGSSEDRKPRDTSSDS